MSLGHVRNVPQRELALGLAVVPNALTALTSVDTFVFQISVSNISGGAVTFLVQDANGKVLIPTTSIAANTAYVIVFPFGVKMTGGVSWQASAAASLHAEVYATYKG